MRNVAILFVFLIINFAVYADECDPLKNEVYRNVSLTLSAWDSGFYSELPNFASLSPSDNAATIEAKLGENESPLWQVNVKCKSRDSIFFELKLLGQVKPEFDGFIKLTNDRYFSGPHSLLPKNVVIIQSEKHAN